MDTSELRAPEQALSGISLDEPRMIDYWCEALSCTLDELVLAEAIAGPGVRDVLRQLGRQLH